MTTNITAKIVDFNNTNLSKKYLVQFCTASGFNAPIISTEPKNVDSFWLLKYNVTGLNLNTKYYTRVADENGNAIDSYVGSFKTPSALGPQNFKFGFGSCSWGSLTSASNQHLYDYLASKGINNALDFFIHLGDIHYSDISQNNEGLFQSAFDSIFSSPRQNNCWKNLPMYYIWDDHDYGPNDSDRNSPSRNAAIAAYRRRAPSPPLATFGSSDAIYYSFIRGRIRFIVTDLVSEREPKGAYPSYDARQKIFSDQQKTWFFNQMLLAKNNGEIICWANTKPWISSIANGLDDWGGYHAARLEIAEFIQSQGLQNRIFIISGDMHALAYDNGTSENNYGALKVCHGGPLDQEVRPKGGPYTVDPIMQDSGQGWANQYGVIEITDNGSNVINIRFKGFVIDRVTKLESIVLDENFNLNI
jgi:alkaline phosphatase D